MLNNNDPHYIRLNPVLEDQPSRALPVLSDALPSAPTTRDSAVRVAVVLAARWLLIAALIAALHVASRQRSTRRASAEAPQIQIPQATLHQWFGVSAEKASLQFADDQTVVLDADGQFLGRVVQTLPDAKSVTGYQGPSNLLIGIDADERIVGVRLITSADTVDHVRSVQQSDTFFIQFQGKSTSEALSDIDVVSGATLTSLAMAESIAVRLGNETPDSGRFPDPISAEECQQVFPAAAFCQPHPSVAGAVEAVGETGDSLGTILRTGTLADRVNGYQGPSELLLGFDPDEKLMHVRVRRTFDNQPYASYVEDEPWYWEPFLGKTPTELASSDLETLGIEGVSGATLSTVAAAETLVQAAQALLHQQAKVERISQSGGWKVRWAWKDSGTILVLMGSLWVTFARFRSKRQVRWIWQATVVVVFGFITGNLLSIALLLGWGTSGVPWRLAPGLAAVVLFAVAVPVLTKSPIYCAQLCPHGALQQWLRRVPRQNWTLPARLSRYLLCVPGLLCIAAYWVALSGAPGNLAAWEPFDAYVIWIGISGSMIVAIASLGLAALSPMGYCRFACPTGRVLSYVRRHSRSGRWMKSDWAVVMLAASAWTWIYWQS